MEIQSKATLLEQIRTERASWNSMLGFVKNERMLEPGACEGWSIKDVIAHLTAWEERPVAWLEAAQGREGVKPAEWPKGMDETQTNAWIYEVNRDRPLSEVLEGSERVNHRLVELIEAIPEGELISPDILENLGGQSLLDAIPGNSHEHYREHANTVRAWLERVNV